MAEETEVAEPEAPPVLRPEAVASLDKLRTEIFGNAGEEKPPVDAPVPAAEAVPAKTDAPPAKPVVAAAPPVVVPDGVLPPEPSEKPTDTPPAEEVFPEEPPAAIKTEKGKADYKKWRAAYKGLEEKVKGLESQKPPEPDDIAKARIAELEGRLTEMSQTIERRSLEDHPAFVQQFVAPINQRIATAKSIIEKSELDPSTLEKVMRMKSDDRVEALDELAAEIKSPTLRTRFEQTMAQIESIEEQRDAVLKDRKGATERLTMAEKADYHRRVEQQIKQTVDTVEGIINYLATDQKDEFFKTGTGDEKWDALMEADKQEIIDLTTKNENQKEVLGAVALGVKYARVKAAYNAVNNLLKIERKKNAELMGAEPKLNGDGGGGSKVDEEPTAQDLDFSIDAIASRVRRSR